MQRTRYSRRLPQHRRDDALVGGFGEDFGIARLRALPIIGSHRISFGADAGMAAGNGFGSARRGLIAGRVPVRPRLADVWFASSFLERGAPPSFSQRSNSGVSSSCVVMAVSLCFVRRSFFVTLADWDITRDITGLQFVQNLCGGRYRKAPSKPDITRLHGMLLTGAVKAPRPPFMTP